MNLKRTIRFNPGHRGRILGVAKALGGESQSGDWTIRRSDVPGKVEFFADGFARRASFSYQFRLAGERFFRLGFSKAGRQEVHFTIARDAGKFRMRRISARRRGRGTISCSARDPKYQQEYEVARISKESMATNNGRMAIHDVSLKFAQDIKAQNLQGLDTDKLIAFKIHGVRRTLSLEFVRQVWNVSDSDKLIAFRIHGVTPEFIAGDSRAGLNVVDSDKLIAFRIHGVSPEMVRSLKQAGTSLTRTN